MKVVLLHGKIHKVLDTFHKLPGSTTLWYTSFCAPVHLALGKNLIFTSHGIWSFPCTHLSLNTVHCLLQTFQSKKFQNNAQSSLLEFILDNLHRNSISFKYFPYDSLSVNRLGSEFYTLLHIDTINIMKSMI